MDRAASELAVCNRTKVSSRDTAHTTARPSVHPVVLHAFLCFLRWLGPLAVDAAPVFDEEAGRAVLELDAVLAAETPAVGAGIISRQDAAQAC